MSSAIHKKSGRIRRWMQKPWFIWVFSLIVILIIIRIMLPHWIVGYLNNRLASIPGYYGHVDQIDLCLYRGAYQIYNLDMFKVDTQTQKLIPFFNVPKGDISIEWKSLFRGRIVSELELINPVLRFTEDAAEPKDLEKDTTDFRTMLKTFTPLKVNRFEIFGGKLQYVDNTVTPAVDISLDNAYILARNLSTVVDTTLLPASIIANANVYGGSMALNMKIDALAEHPTFDLNAEIKDANLVRLNDFFKAYADFDVHKGTFGMYMEMAARDRKFIGYVKPLITGLDVTGPEDRKDNPLRKLWEGFVNLVADVLENPKSDKIAAKIPISGSYDDTTIGIWYAVLSGLSNGFIQAIYPALDYQVTIGSVQAVETEEKNKNKFFKKLFGKPSESKQEKSKSKKD